MDSITLDLLGFDEYQAAKIISLLGGGLKEFKVHRLQDLAPSDLLEITGRKFSATVSLWTLIEQLLSSHEAKCQDSEDEYLELEKAPRGFEEISIEDVGLSIRPVNVLRRENITTLSQLSSYSREELLNLGNLGVGSVNEIEKVLTSRGFKRDIDALPGTGTFIGSDIPLSSLPLTTRTSNSLLRIGVTKLSEVLGLSHDDLRDIRNVGHKSIAEVEEIQSKYGSNAPGQGERSSSSQSSQEQDLKWASGQLMAEVENLAELSVDSKDLSINQFSLDGFDFGSSLILARYLESGPISLETLLANLRKSIEASKGKNELMSLINFTNVLGANYSSYSERRRNYLFSEDERKELIRFENRFSNENIDLLEFDAATTHILDLNLTEQRAFLGKGNILDLMQTVEGHFITHPGPWEVIRSTRRFFSEHGSFPSLIGLVIALARPKGDSKDEISNLLEKILRLRNPSFVDRDLQIIQMRIDGQTLDSIGKSVGITRERVRQVIKKISPLIETTIDYLNEDKVRHISQANLEAVQDLFEDFGAIYLSELAHRLETDEKSALAMTPKHFHKFIIDKSAPPVYVSQWTRADVISILQKAGTYYFPLKMADYEYLLEIGEIRGPSIPLIIKKFGVWSELCLEAGVESAPSLKGEYVRMWSEEELISFVERFILDEGTTGSAGDYDEWRLQQTDHVPSGALVRNHFSKWTDVKRIALESIRKKKGKTIRS